jgi:dihydrofolate reductase
MRKLRLQVQISVDGFVSTGPNDEQHWVTWAWEEIKEHVLWLLDTSDTILIGRKLAMDYIPYWIDVNKQPDHEMYQVARRITEMNKVVFSKSLNKSEWENTVIANGNLVEEVNKLKNAEGKDLIVYGGSSFVSSLIRENLVDEFHLFVNPVALGNGGAIFSGLKDVQQLQFKQSVTFNCGIVLLVYMMK